MNKNENNNKVEGNVEIIETKKDIVLELVNINKIYNTKSEKLHVLKDINLKIEEGEFISIIGKSGSGKSTLLNLLGLLDKATSGELYINSTLVKNLKDREKDELKNKNLGFIFQFHYLLSEFTALENVMLPGLKSNYCDINQIRKRAIELLKIVGLEKRKNHKPTEMSGGEKQRVAIARALINSPKIILADEPTGNLDDETGEIIHDLLKKINKELGQTIVVVTHSKELSEISQKILKIKKGKLEAI